MVRHRGVYGVLIRKGRILLIEKSVGPYKGLWDLPGGRAEHEEGPFETLAREVREETGVIVKKARFLFSLEAVTGDFHHFGEIFLIEECDLSGFNSAIAEQDVLSADWKLTSESDRFTPFAKAVLNS